MRCAPGGNDPFSNKFGWANNQVGQLPFGALTLNCRGSPRTALPHYFPTWKLLLFLSEQNFLDRARRNVLLEHASHPAFFGGAKGGKCRGVEAIESVGAGKAVLRDRPAKSIAHPQEQFAQRFGIAQQSLQ